MKFIPRTTVISSKSELSTIIDDLRIWRDKNNFFGFGLTHQMYRGQGNDEWKLEPSICRKIRNVNDLKRIEKEIITEFHEKLVREEKSKRILPGFLNGAFHGDWLLIQQAQHYGIPTRFMDWSIRWDVALYFAVFNPSNDIYDGEFWIYNLPAENLLVDNATSTYRMFDPYTYEKSNFLNSASFSSPDYILHIGVKRKNVQQGRFLIQSYTDILIPLQSKTTHSNNLIKISIPKNVKSNIRAELEKNEITQKALYVEEDPFIEKLKLELIKKYGI